MANVFHFEIFLKYFLVFLCIFLASQAPKKLSQTLFYFSFLFTKNYLGDMWLGCLGRQRGAWLSGKDIRSTPSTAREGRGVHRVTYCICMVSRIVCMFLIYSLYIWLTHTLNHTHTHAYTHRHTHMLTDTFIKYAAYAACAVRCSQFPIPVPCYCSLSPTSTTFL